MFVPLPEMLKDAVCTDRPDLIENALTQGPVLMATRQGELMACLELAMPTASLGMISQLLTLGATLSGQSIWSAVKRQNPDVLQLLIDFGWDVDSTQCSLAMIHCAVRYPTSLRWLLEQGANPNIKSERRDIGSCLQRATALDYAAKRSEATAVKMLLSHGAALDADAIYFAIRMRYQKNSTETLQALIEQGADVNYVHKKWCTPLYHAVRRGSIDKVRMLLEHGADPEIRSLNGRTSALDSAEQERYMEKYEVMMDAAIKRAAAC